MHCIEKNQRLPIRNVIGELNLLRGHRLRVLSYPKKVPVFLQTTLPGLADYLLGIGRI